MTEEVYVKECHFCGSAEIDIDPRDTFEGEIISIDCLDCGFKMEKSFPLGITDGIEQLTDIWNKHNTSEEYL